MHLLHNEVLEKARAAFASGQTRSFSFRMQQLKNLVHMLCERENEFLNVLKLDMRKSAMESSVELEAVKVQINHQIRHLKNYMKPEHVPLNLFNFTDRSFIQKEPYGVVLILGTWNYPFGMTMIAFSGALASGNCAIIKPSEMAPNSSALLAKLLPLYLNNECFHVIEADLSGTEELLKNRFDYIFATGSHRMGKCLMVAASAYLTPLTLELGGKSPVYIHDSSDVKMAAKRILWGKFVNLGQTCIAPDFIICSQLVEKEFLNTARELMFEWYGKNWKLCPHLPRIVNDRHFLRLQNLLKTTNGQIAIGGEMDEKDLWIAPTILVDVDISDAVMEEEIFGPILPIVTIESADTAIRFINSRLKPLALYVFSKDDSIVQTFLEKTSSGGVCVNDVLMHSITDGLPFGGVGSSGFGSFRGKYSFDTFTHKRGVLQRNWSTIGELSTSVRYPPYNESKRKLIKLLALILHHFDMSFGKTVVILMVAFLAAAYFCL